MPATKFEDLSSKLEKLT
jgi:chromosome segregation ATPase